MNFGDIADEEGQEGCFGGTAPEVGVAEPQDDEVIEEEEEWAVNCCSSGGRGCTHGDRWNDTREEIIRLAGPEDDMDRAR